MRKKILADVKKILPDVFHRGNTKVISTLHNGDLQEKKSEFTLYPNMYFI